MLDQAGQVYGIIDGSHGSSPGVDALSNLQIQPVAAQGADRTTPISDGRCVSNQK